MWCMISPLSPPERSSGNDPNKCSYCVDQCPEKTTYILKHFDTSLLIFSADREVPSVDADYEIVWIDENKWQLLPFGIECVPEGVASWVKRRNIPKNRAFASTFLARNGFQLHTPSREGFPEETSFHDRASDPPPREDATGIMGLEAWWDWDNRA